MKRYALAAVAAVNSTADATGTWYLAAAGALLVLVFWGMDAQYLTLERQYRWLYDKVREATGPTDFSLGISEEIGKQEHFSSTLFGWSARWFYGALLGISVIITLVIAAFPAPA
ncbi:hypothetical protein [Salipiger mangrovisoli]|uniref:Uncharacterized protein n=1 Tax=Salipiger mangrovisoli TaxID=2865933 RepID=A0ABR9X8A5_9RHOB|nr:hypothetical protein [Salipiger mangrovisoli]MBE9639777.1 hypothetical protein [Salipiger mangrovisoli]